LEVGDPLKAILKWAMTKNFLRIRFLFAILLPSLALIMAACRHTEDIAENSPSEDPYKGLAFIATVSGSPHAAIINAVTNACGVRITRLPALPEKVKAALDAKA
jgi:hypothetical protein